MMGRDLFVLGYLGLGVLTWLVMSWIDGYRGDVLGQNQVLDFLIILITWPVLVFIGLFLLIIWAGDKMQEMGVRWRARR